MAGLGTAHLLQENCVVTLEGLEDIMVAAQGAKAVHSCIAMTATALTADGQSLCCVLRCVRLESYRQAASQDGRHTPHDKYPSRDTRNM